MIVKRGEEIPDELILSRMENGDKLTATRIAARLAMSPEKVRKKLLSLVAQGKVKREREGKSLNLAYLYFVEQAQIIAGGAYEIPTPFVGVNLTGELVGYAQEMNARAALCMTLRRVA
jgi:DNA-binding transcriptional ArsR family regulator